MIIVLVLSIVILLVVILWFVFKRVNESPPDTSTPTYSKLMLGDTQHPFAEIERFTPTVSQQLEALPASQQQLSSFTAIFQHAPSLASSVLTGAKDTYVLRFAPDVVAKLNNGTLSLMSAAQGGLRSIAVDANGTIVSHGTLFKISNISSLAVSVFGILAIVSELQYKSQLNRRLINIEQGINEIKEHLKTQDTAILSGNLKQLKSLRIQLDEPKFYEAELSAGIVSLDTIDRECGQILEAYRHHMVRYATELDTLTLSDMFTSNFKDPSTVPLKY